MTYTGYGHGQSSCNYINNLKMNGVLTPLSVTSRKLYTVLRTIPMIRADLSDSGPRNCLNGSASFVGPELTPRVSFWAQNRRYGSVSGPRN
jgi:hypothetical protein